jgi:hypothetical protein
MAAKKTPPKMPMKGKMPPWLTPAKKKKGK